MGSLRSTLRRFGLLTTFACAGSACEPGAGSPVETSAAAEVATPFTWPTPPGWRAETIPFPLPFAPELPYHGVETLRFGPRFFDVAAPMYFTYSFAFVLDPDQDGTIVPFVADRLAADLRAYFTGLASAVTKKAPDPTLHGAEVTSNDGAKFRGEVRTIDPFGDGHALALHVDGNTFVCGKRRIILSSLSPLASDHTVWSVLSAQRATFVCGAAESRHRLP